MSTPKANILKILCLPAIVLLAGCATFSGGAPRLGSDDKPCTDGPVSQSIRNVLVDLQCTSVDWLTGSSDALKTQRNNVVTIRMFLIDKQYNDWEREIVNESRSGNFTTTLLSLGLSGAGAVMSQGDTSRTLAALNTAATGAKQGYDKDILLDQTMQILMTQMRASRAKVKELLIRRLNTTYDTWPIGLALSDLEAYEHAGTVNSALMSMAETASSSKQQNEDRADQAVVTIEFDSSAGGTALRTYLNVTEPSYTARADKLVAAMSAVGIQGTTRKSMADFVVGNDIRKKDVIMKLMALERSDRDVLQILASGI